jgi:hypothetical protein
MGYCSERETAAISADAADSGAEKRPALQPDNEITMVIAVIDSINGDTVLNFIIHLIGNRPEFRSFDGTVHKRAMFLPDVV